MNEIVVTDPFRPHIDITLSGSISENADGTWDAYLCETNPGYARAYRPTKHRTKKKAKKWVRARVAERLAEIEATRTRLLIPDQKVDLTGIR